MGVTLKPVSAENWYACTKLNVRSEQLHVFPAPVVYWIAESKYVDDFELRAVYWEDEVAGFIVFRTKPDMDGSYWIPAIMIDEKHQGKGCGRAAMEQLIACMRGMNCKRLMIGHRPENHAAACLYESLGFRKLSEEVIDGEIIRLLHMD
ncbi:GNAT family N-acetyltransferase [Paenibacillus lycopersici]|uniref:GNAT family N-acetyltransferase n=1 Tax=Paenibacillus lycopersici TaxID=2704462 RepID=A0A6C0FRS3_9BACL|nr:GNAT family N-acetyltransferase [Paenibacillus lycopersici]QHT59838.1 GNAT family N-acetyltransferase [Paenibacillus lycopersici]